MHRDFEHAKLTCSLEPGMANDDHSIFVDDDRLAEAELLDRLNDSFDSGVVVAGVVGIGGDGINRTILYFQGWLQMEFQPVTTRIPTLLGNYFDF